MKKIFISHSSKDEMLASEVLSFLESEGNICWISSRDIDLSADWAGQITEALENETELVLLLLSQDANESPQVEKEVNIADDLKLKIVVIQTDKLTMSKALRYHLSIQQVYICKEDSEDAKVDEILHLLSKPGWKLSLTSKSSPSAQNFKFDRLEDYVDRGIEPLLSAAFEKSEVPVLFGEGGMGKSCIAKQYYLNNQTTYAAMMYLNAETPHDVLKSLGIPESDDLADLRSTIMGAIKRYLSLFLTKEDDRALLIVDNFSYDRRENDGLHLVQYESAMSDVINSLSSNAQISIIVTTRQREISINRAKMLYIGDFSESLALDYLQKNFSYPFDEAAAVRLIKKYGTERKEGETQGYCIPAISCAAIKNTAINRGGYQNVDAMVGAKAGLAELVDLQLASLGKDSRGSIFVDLLKIASFLSGTAIPKDALIEILKEWRGDSAPSDDTISDCLAYYNSKLTLLNYLSDGTGAFLAMHRRFQVEINKLIVDERKDIKDSILRYFSQHVFPFSYYGTQTMSDPHSCMQQFLAFFEMVRGERNSTGFYRMLRIIGWYYGFRCRDKDMYQLLSEDLTQDRQVPEFERILACLDKLLLTMMLDGAPVDPDDLADLEDDIADYDGNGDHSDIERNILLIRFYVVQAYYDCYYSTMNQGVTTLTKAKKLAEDMLSLGQARGNMAREDYIYFTEAMVEFCCRLAVIDRRKAGSFEDSLKECENALAYLNDRRYIRYLDKLGMPLGNTYLSAFAHNLQGVTLMERSSSLLELYLAEDLNRSALEEYLSIDYLPGVANQQINFTNIFRAQALLIIDKVNQYLNPTGAPLTPNQWQELYARETIVPDLIDRDGNEKSVHDWLVEYRYDILHAKENREFSKETKASYNAAVSVDYYAYLFTLAVCQTHFNGYTNEEKRTILIDANHKQINTDDGACYDGLEEALRQPELDNDNKAIFLRYQGILNKKLFQLSENEEQRLKHHQLARSLFEQSIALATSSGNQHAKRLAEAELKRLS